MSKKRILNFTIPFLLIVAAFSLGLTTAPTPPARFYLPQAEAYFSPDGGCRDRIISLIELSQESLDVAIYAFNSKKIAAALSAADRRGVAVRVLSDRYNAKRYVNLILMMRHSGVEIKFDRRESIYHNKFIVIDGHAILTGSYNFTDSAEFKNAENILILDNPEIASKFTADFNHHWHHAKDQ